MEYTQKCITGTQTFPISKLSGWKHTNEFNKSSKITQQKILKRLRQHLCHGNQLVIGNRGGWWTVSSKQGNYPDKEADKTLYKDRWQEHQQFSSSKEKTHQMGMLDLDQRRVKI